MKVILALAVMFLTGCGFEVVDPGHRGIETNLGKVVGEPLPEGLHFYNPFTASIKEFNVRQETWSIKTPIFTKDNQTVQVEFTVTYSADPKFVNTIYLEYGNENQMVEKALKPTVLGSLKDAIGLVNADELVSKRAWVTKSAMTEVTKNLEPKHILVSDLQFTNLDFDDAYEKAAEDKVVATQKAQKAVNDTVTIKELAKQTVETAKAQAEAMKIQSEALAKNQGLVQYELAKKWDGKLPMYMMGNSIPFIDMKSLSK